MARVQLGDGAAPFAEARARGFLFGFQGWDDLHGRLDQYWDEAPAPLLISGPLGSGKSTAVRSWLRHRGVNPLSVAVLEAGWLQSDRAAEDILLAFGHRPTEAADAVGALIDFAEDRAELGEPLFVLIANMHEGPEGLVLDLLELDEQLDLGGQGIHLVMTVDLEHWQEADYQCALHTIEHFALQTLTEGETERVASAVLSAERVHGDHALDFSDAAISVLYEESRGLIGLIGSLFDDAVHHAMEDGRSLVLPEDFGVAPTAWREVHPEAVRLDEAAAYFAAYPVPRPPVAPIRRFAFPQITTAAGSMPTPANDRRRPVDGKLYGQLQSLHEQTRALEDHLTAIRRSVAALQSRSDARQRALADRASHLSEAFPSLDGDR
ncbi:MAG: hypothetical protein AAGA39_04750 [Pseudomonadota bacterium]